MEKTNTQPVNSRTVINFDSALEGSNSQESSMQQSQDSMLSVKVSRLTYNEEVKNEMVAPVNQAQEFELSDRQPSRAFTDADIEDLYDEVFQDEACCNRDFEKLYELIESYIANPKLPDNKNKSDYMVAVKSRSVSKKYGKTRWLWPNNNPPIICLICNRTVRKSNYSNKHFYNCAKRNSKAYFEDCKQEVDMDPNFRYQYFKLDQHAINVIVGVGNFLDTVIHWRLYADILEQKYNDYGKMAGLIDKSKMSKAPKFLFRIKQPIEIRSYHIVDKVQEIRAYHLKQHELALHIKKYKDSKGILDNTQAFLELLQSFDNLDEKAFDEFIAFAKSYSKQAKSFPVEKYITSDYKVQIDIKDIKKSLTKLNPRQILDILIEACQHKMKLQRATGVMQIICSSALKVLGTKNMKADKQEANKDQGKRSKSQRSKLDDSIGNADPIIEHPAIRLMKEVMIDCCQQYQLSNLDLSQSQFLKKRVFKESSKGKSRYLKEKEAFNLADQFVEGTLQQKQNEESKELTSEQLNHHIQNSQIARPSQTGAYSIQNPQPQLISSPFTNKKILSGRRIEMPADFNEMDKSDQCQQRLDKRTDAVHFNHSAQSIQESEQEVIEDSPLSEVVKDGINWTNSNIQQQQKININFSKIGFQAQVGQFLSKFQREGSVNEQQDALALSSLRAANLYDLNGHALLDEVVNEKFPSQFNNNLKQSSERLQYKVQLVSSNQSTSKLQERQQQPEVNAELEEQKNQTSQREVVQPLNTLGQKRRYQDALLEIRRLHPHLRSDIDNCLLIDERVKQYIEGKVRKGESLLQGNDRDYVNTHIDQDRQKNQQYYRSKRAKTLQRFSQVFFGGRPSADKATADKKCPQGTMNQQTS